MEREAILELFRRSGALLDGHFRLSSGLHSSGYLQCALVLQHPHDAASLGSALAKRVSALQPATVLSPALGGVVIGQEVARVLGTRAIFAERHDGVLTLRRGFALEPAERVLVVEDVITTGRSTQETIDVARQAGAVVVGVGAIVNRGGPVVRFDVPAHSLVTLTLPTFESTDCPLCAAGAPIVKPGSRPAGTR